jgi:hypothetical protein
MRRMWLKRFGVQAGPERDGRAVPYLGDPARDEHHPSALSRFLPIVVRRQSNPHPRWSSSFAQSRY